MELGLRKIVFAVLLSFVFATFIFAVDASGAPYFDYKVEGSDSETESSTEDAPELYYVQFDSKVSTYVYGAIRVKYSNPDKVECVSIEEVPYTLGWGFWTAWTPAPADIKYVGTGGTLYRYRLTDGTWANWWASLYGDGIAGPSGSIDYIDPENGIIRFFTFTRANSASSKPLRFVFKLKVGVKGPVDVTFTIASNNGAGSSAYNWADYSDATNKNGVQTQAETFTIKIGPAVADDTEIVLLSNDIYEPKPSGIWTWKNGIAPDHAYYFDEDEVSKIETEILPRDVEKVEGTAVSPAPDNNEIPFLIAKPEISLSRYFLDPQNNSTELRINFPDNYSLLSKLGEVSGYQMIKISGDKAFLNALTPASLLIETGDYFVDPANIEILGKGAGQGDSPDNGTYLCFTFSKTANDEGAFQDDERIATVTFNTIGADETVTVVEQFSYYDYNDAHPVNNGANTIEENKEKLYITTIEVQIPVPNARTGEKRVYNKKSEFGENITLKQNALNKLIDFVKNNLVAGALKDELIKDIKSLIKPLGEAEREYDKSNYAGAYQKIKSEREKLDNVLINIFAAFGRDNPALNVIVLQIKEINLKLRVNVMIKSVEFPTLVMKDGESEFNITFRNINDMEEDFDIYLKIKQNHPATGKAELDGATDGKKKLAYEANKKTAFKIEGKEVSVNIRDVSIQIAVVVKDGVPAEEDFNDFIVAGVVVGKFTVIKLEIDGLVYGEAAKKIDNLIDRSTSADTDDDVRVISGGYVKFEADITPAVDDDILTYAWTVDKGSPEADKTRKDLKWDAPATENDITLKLKLSENAIELGEKEAKLKSIVPKVVRVKFVDAGDTKYVALRDHINGNITAPQFDRVNTGYDESKEFGPLDFKNDQNLVYKNESAAYVRGGKIRVQIDIAATDLADNIGGVAHTATQHKDLTVVTPIKMSSASTSPKLAYTNKASNAAESNEIAVGDWSDKDYDLVTNDVTFTSEALADKIDFQWEMTLKWTFKVKNKDGNWISAIGNNVTNDTKHRSLGVVNAMPVKPSYGNGNAAGNFKEASKIVWEKVLQWSCDSAKNKGGDNAAAKKAIVNSIWGSIDADTSNDGAKINLDYDLNVAGPKTTNNLLDKNKGSCGNWAVFFADLAAAQGIKVDVESISLTARHIKDSVGIAVNSKDIDGDWCTIAGGPVNAAGNKMWWFSGGIEHSVCQYGTAVYDPTFGEMAPMSNWDKYLAGAIAQYYVATAAGPPVVFAWKTKAQVIADYKVRFRHYRNYQPVAGEGEIVWPPFP